MPSSTSPHITYNDYYDWEVSCKAAISNESFHGDERLRDAVLQEIKIPFHYEMVYEKSALLSDYQSAYVGHVSGDSDVIITDIIKRIEWRIFLDLALKSSLLYENKNNNIHNPTARYEPGHVDCIERATTLLFPKSLPDILSSGDFYDIIEEETNTLSVPQFRYMGIHNNPIDEIDPENECKVENIDNFGGRACTRVNGGITILVPIARHNINATLIDIDSFKNELLRHVRDGMEKDKRYSISEITELSFLGQHHNEKDVSTLIPRQTDLEGDNNNATNEQSKRMTPFGISLVVFISFLVVGVAFFCFRKGKKMLHEKKQKKDETEATAILPTKNTKKLSFNMEKIKVWNTNRENSPKLDIEKFPCGTKAQGDGLKIKNEAKVTTAPVNHFVMHSIERSGVEVIEMNVSGCPTVSMEDDSSAASSSSEIEEYEEEGDLLLHNSPTYTPPRSMKEKNQDCMFPDLVDGYEVTMDVDCDVMSKESV